MDINNKIQEMPEDVKNYFSSNEPRLDYKLACFLYGVNDENQKFEKIADFIGKIFLREAELKLLPIFLSRDLGLGNEIAFSIAFVIGKKTFSKFPDYFKDIEELMEKWNTIKINPLVSDEKAQRRLLDSESWIEKEEKEKEKEKLAQQEEVKKQMQRLDKLPLAQALSKYSKLGEQTIGTNMIKLKYFPTPVRPSIKNWITDYHDFLGGGKHNTYERGNYLFHSDNSKTLTPAEKQKLTQIFRSIDEEVAIFVDPDRQEIVFTEAPQTESQARQLSQPIQTQPQQTNEQDEKIFQQKEKIAYRLEDIPDDDKPMGKLSFSSPQAFNPQIKSVLQKNQNPFRITTPTEGYKNPTQNSPQINAKNVVNLKD